MLRGALLILFIAAGVRGQLLPIPSGIALAPATADDEWNSVYPSMAPEARAAGVLSFRQARHEAQTVGAVTGISEGGTASEADVESDVAAQPLQATASPSPKKSPPPPPARPPPPPPRPPPPPPVSSCLTQTFSTSAGANGAVGTLGSFSFSGWSYDVQVQSGNRAIFVLKDQATFKATASTGVALCGLSLASYSTNGYATISATTVSGAVAPSPVSNFFIPAYPNTALLSVNPAVWTGIASITIQTSGLGGPDLFYISYQKLS